jgi:methionyl-tRNA formyltransferase
MTTDVLFMGTSAFAVPSLRGLLRTGYAVREVFTQPDRLKGRNGQLRPTPVKAAALAAGCSVRQPASIKQPETVEYVLAQPVDFIVVASYGQIIPPAILSHPRYGCLNVHASLLPAYRGAAPIQRAIMDGRSRTGVTIMAMDAGLDTGDMLDWAETDIGEKDAGDLEAELAELGAKRLLSVLAGMTAGTVTRVRQDETQASYAPRLTGQDEILDFSRPAEILCRQIRGLSPQPGAYTRIGGKRLKVFAARTRGETRDAVSPGQILEVTEEGFLVQTGDGLLEFLQVQREGKSRVGGREFARGVPGLSGTVLGDRSF